MIMRTRSIDKNIHTAFSSLGFTHLKLRSTLRKQAGNNPVHHGYLVAMDGWKSPDRSLQVPLVESNHDMIRFEIERIRRCWCPKLGNGRVCAAAAITTTTGHERSLNQKAVNK